MSKSSGTDRYIEGQNMVLDKKYLAYKKMNIWAGPAVGGALREDEIDMLLVLDKKQKRCAWKLSVQEVSTLVAWSPFIVFYTKYFRV